MGFLSSKNAGENDRAVRDTGSESRSARQDDFYADLITRRPGLLDEKLKLHERIIDEFNLTALEKMPSDELAKQVRTYVATTFAAKACPSIRRNSTFSPTRSSPR